MKILAMIMLVLLILAVGFVGYVYKKNAMFLPALFGIGGFQIGRASCRERV